MTRIERGTSSQLHTAVLVAFQVAILAAMPALAVGDVRLIDETRLDGTRELGWYSNSGIFMQFDRSPTLVVRASCSLDVTQESDRLRLRFGWRDMPQIDDGAAILFRAGENPVQELPARMADGGSIEVLAAEEVISQLIGEREFVLGVRGAGGAIEERSGYSWVGDEGVHTLEAFRSRCLNPDQPRATQDTARGRSFTVSGANLHIQAAENGDLVLQNNLVRNDMLRFRCLSEPQTWGGHSWSAGTMILAIPRFLNLLDMRNVVYWEGRARQDRFDGRRFSIGGDNDQPLPVPVSFDEGEPQELDVSREFTTEESPALAHRDLSGRHWTTHDASPILAKALVSEQMRVGTSSLFVGDLAVEVFIDRARRQGCYNNLAVQQPAVPATSDDQPSTQQPSTPTQTPTRITDENIPFIYESRAEAPDSDVELLERISSDYSRFMSDEFARRDLEEQLRPILDSRLLEARAINRVTVDFGSDLGAYDFERSAFPTYHNTSTYVRFGPYSVRFSNAADLSFVPVAEDVARDLVSSMRDSRAISLSVTGTIVRVERSASTGKTVYVRAEQVDVALRSGSAVGTIEL